MSGPFEDPITTEDGQAIPPQGVLDGLRRVNPALGLRFCQSMVAPYWAVTFEWPDNDPRRARIRAGTADPRYAFDIIGEIPRACSLDEVPNYVARMFREHPSQEISKMLEELHRYNLAVQDDAWNEMLDSPEVDARNRIEVQGGALFDTADGVLDMTVPKVRQAGVGEAPVLRERPAEEKAKPAKAGGGIVDRAKGALEKVRKEVTKSVKES